MLSTRINQFAQTFGTKTAGVKILFEILNFIFFVRLGFILGSMCEFVIESGKKLRSTIRLFEENLIFFTAKSEKLDQWTIR